MFNLKIVTVVFGCNILLMSNKPMRYFLLNNYLSSFLSITDSGELKIYDYGYGFVVGFFIHIFESLLLGEHRFSFVMSSDELILLSSGDALLYLW